MTEKISNFDMNRKKLQEKAPQAESPWQMTNWEKCDYNLRNLPNLQVTPKLKKMICMCRKTHVSLTIKLYVWQEKCKLNLQGKSSFDFIVCLKKFLSH